MNRKLIFNIVAIILAIATITIGVLLVIKNTGDCVIALGSNTALSGDTVSIPLTITKNPGAWGGQIIIDYDADNLNFISASNGGVFDACEVNDTGDSVVLLVTQSTLTNTKQNDLIATINFKVKDSADKGVCEITFNPETNFCNSEEELLETVLKSGSITIK